MIESSCIEIGNAGTHLKIYQEKQFYTLNQFYTYFLLRKNNKKMNEYQEIV